MRTLVALVPAAIEGVVRDVVLAASAATPDLARIADHAGCDFVVADARELMPAALARLKEQRVFVLRAGRIPEHGFIGELADLMAYGAERCALLRDAPHSMLTRIAPGLSPASALVAPRARLATCAADVRQVARRLPAPVVFKARMIGDA